MIDYKAKKNYYSAKKKAVASGISAKAWDQAVIKMTMVKNPDFIDKALAAPFVTEMMQYEKNQ